MNEFEKACNTESYTGDMTQECCIENEEWRDVVGYETYYQVSNYGRVRSLRNCWNHFFPVPKLRKLFQDRNGYWYLGLTRNGATKGCYVHRLVAQAFIPNPDNLPEVNHKDEDPSNPKLDNLEWCTKKYNAEYGTAIARSRLKMQKPISQYTLDGELVATYAGTKIAEMLSKTYHITETCIGEGTYITPNKFLWRKGIAVFDVNKKTVKFIVEGRVEAEILESYLMFCPPNEKKRRKICQH